MQDEAVPRLGSRALDGMKENVEPPSTEPQAQPPVTVPAPPQNPDPPKKKALPKPLRPGKKEAHFGNNNDWKRLEADLGTKTRKITFGSRDEGFDLAE